VNTETITIAYPETRDTIVAKLAIYADLGFGTPKEYAEGTKAIAHCRTTRVQVEARRKELKASSLDFGRRVDAVAKELTALIENIELPLRERKAAVDDAKERAKAEREAAERAAVEAQVRAAREAEEARLRAERAAEEARLAVERERLAAERAALAEQRRKEEDARAAEDAALRAQRERLDAERRELERERARATAEREAKAQAERERVASDEARRAEEQRVAEHARRLAELQPDLVKLAAFAGAIRALQAPSVGADAKVALDITIKRLERAASELEQWGKL
jgi:hypothetical protein